MRKISDLAWTLLSLNPISQSCVEMTEVLVWSGTAPCVQWSALSWPSFWHTYDQLLIIARYLGNVQRVQRPYSTSVLLQFCSLCLAATPIKVEAIRSFIKIWLYFFKFLLERLPTKLSRLHNCRQSPPPIGTHLLFVNGPGWPDWQPAVLPVCGAKNHGASETLSNFRGGSQTHAYTRIHTWSHVRLLLNLRQHTQQGAHWEELQCKSFAN